MSKKFTSKSSVAEFYAFLAGQAAGRKAAYMLEARVSTDHVRAMYAGLARKANHSAIHFMRSWERAHEVQS